MKRSWMVIIGNFILLLAMAAVVFGLFGCSTQPKAMEPLLSYEELSSMIVVTKREFVTLRTGQVCEVKDGKIVACERNPSIYAETVEDIEAIVGEDNE